jgi:hypothetical protein
VHAEALSCADIAAGRSGTQAKLTNFERHMGVIRPMNLSILAKSSPSIAITTPNLSQKIGQIF